MTVYTQQYRQPPKDYGGTAISKDAVPAQKAPVAEIKGSAGFGTDELLIAIIIMIVMSGGADKNAMLLLALVFILL